MDNNRDVFSLLVCLFKNKVENVFCSVADLFEIFMIFVEIIYRETVCKVIENV